MSRNLLRTDCYFCHGPIRLDEKPRPIRDSDAGRYFDEYEGMLDAHSELVVWKEATGERMNELNADRERIRLEIVGSMTKAGVFMLGGSSVGRREDPAGPGEVRRAIERLAAERDALAKKLDDARRAGQAFYEMVNAAYDELREWLRADRPKTGARQAFHCLSEAMTMESVSGHDTRPGPDADPTHALEAVLLFHAAGPWDAVRAARWKQITGTDDATTRTLCDTVRAALPKPTEGA